MDNKGKLFGTPAWLRQSDRRRAVMGHSPYQFDFQLNPLDHDLINLTVS